MSDTTQINIAVVDDHNLFRKGMIKLIKMGDTKSRYNILFEVDGGLSLQKAIRKDQLPDIVLMDIDMPNMDGFDTVEWLKTNYPDVKVLVVSMLATDDAILKMLRKGVKGYLSKDIEVEDVHRALEAIAGGGLYYSGFVSEVFDKMTTMDAAPTAVNAFSEIDQQFFKLICTDLTYEQIADEMCLSPKTIDGYRAKFFQRFHVKSRQALVYNLLKDRIISFDE
ncbi:MAG: response regulator transcription factor [Bacteroidota bacterium]